MTEKFAPSWLETREPVDHRSRSAELLPPLREWWADNGLTSVLDLGCGTGSNLRYLAPRLAGPQRWVVVDHDAELLARISDAQVGVELERIQGDLTDLLAPTAESDWVGHVSDAHLVTASALLDLVSEAWLDRLVDACAGAGCGALFALSYDGVVGWAGDGELLDGFVLEAVNEHQRGDKGFGPALGPRAGPVAEQLFRKHDYTTWLAPSPWMLGADDSGLARLLVDGWAHAVTELRPDAADDVLDWARRRGAAVSAGHARLMVGHFDLLALPSSR